MSICGINLNEDEEQRGADWTEAIYQSETMTVGLLVLSDTEVVGSS
jgi:hypothetical protein